MNEYFKCVEVEKKWMSFITYIYYTMFNTLFILTLKCMICYQMHTAATRSLAIFHCDNIAPGSYGCHAPFTKRELVDSCVSFLYERTCMLFRADHGHSLFPWCDGGYRRGAALQMKL